MSRKDSDDYGVPLFTCYCCDADIVEGETYYMIDNGDRLCLGCVTQTIAEADTEED